MIMCYFYLQFAVSIMDITKTIALDKTQEDTCEILGRSIILLELSITNSLMAKANCFISNDNH